MSSIFSEKKHILVISNEPRMLAELKMELIASFEVSIAATCATALAAMDKHHIEAAVIHIGEDRENAFSVYSDISASANNKGVPVLFLAEKDNVDDEARAFLAGAVDYAVIKRNGAEALINRISLRILAGENERHVNSAACEPLSSAADPETVLADKTILVVDDVELNRDLIEGMLFEIDSLTLDFAGDGKEALEKYTDAPDRYALILMDVQMPVMSGIDATRAIRSLDFDNARDIPIIALTAGVEEEDIASYLEAGMNDFLKKPMDYSLLLNMVSKYCV